MSDPFSPTAKARAFFARFVAARGATRDPRIEAAFSAVPREAFAGPGPWSIAILGSWLDGSSGPAYVLTPDDDPTVLYQDVLIALIAEEGVNIGEPSLHAHCLDALAPRSGETILQVGAGSGYYTAILAHLVGQHGRVHAFEIDGRLAERAETNLRRYPQVSVEARSGTIGGLPDTDAIYVNAGGARPSPAWLDALRVGGRLLFPLQPTRGLGGMLLVRKPPDGVASWPARFISRARFIACHGCQADDGGQSLAAAFAGGGLDRVASLRFDAVVRDACWFDGGDWWLSTKPPPM